MQKGTKQILGTLGVLGAGGLLLHEITKSKDSATSETKTALGFTGETDLAIVIKETVRNDKGLQQLLKGQNGSSIQGEKGKAGLTWKGAWSNATAYVLDDAVTSGGSSYRCKVGHTNQPVTNTTYWEVIAQKGETGTSGSEIKAFGNSLVKNSAIELNNLEGWTGNGIALGDAYEGLLTMTLTSVGSLVIATNTNRFYINNRRLYKLTCFAKSEGASYHLTLRRYDRNDAQITHAGDLTLYPLNNATLNNTTFQRIVRYFGGIGTTSANIGLDTVKGTVSVSTSIAGVVTVSKLRIEEVSLGEAVPYNLAYLPEGQTVYDPTTSKLGYYNGTAIVWST